VNSPDAAADKLALRIGGRSRVRFEFGPDNEFDVVSWRYVAQTKPANLTYGSDWREQAKTTFEVGIKTGRTPYFHFDGPPKAAVLRALDRYADRYGIKPIIDLVPLGG
jgi:Restriction endonuclease fold toxin 3